VFVPTLNFNGDASFVFNVKSAFYTSTSAFTVTVTVNPQNDPPVADSLNLQAFQETDLPFAVSGNVGVTYKYLPLL
jgi:hypothetical protein